MTTPRLALLLLALPLAGCFADSGAPADAAPEPASSPYVAHETRGIKALPDDAVADLLAGKGMGYALAAELNSWPGPLHALELAHDLRLTDAQRAELERIRGAMLDEVIPLGRALVDAEARLDEAFASRDVDEARLDALVAESARIEGELRAAHLRAHLATTRALTPEQVHAYDRLRGYGGDGDAHAHGGGHGG